LVYTKGLLRPKDNDKEIIEMLYKELVNCLSYFHEFCQQDCHSTTSSESLEKSISSPTLYTMIDHKMVNDGLQMTFKIILDE